MSNANVQSLAAMHDFRVQMLEFQTAGLDVLAALQQQILGFLDWLEHDRPNFWKQYMLQSFDVIAQCRSDLERCLMRTVAGHKPTCYEEKLALQAGKQRLEMAQEKIEAVKRWTAFCEHEVDEHEGRRGGLQRYLEVEFERSLATLQRMTAAIEAYANIDSNIDDLAPPAAEFGA